MTTAFTQCQTLTRIGHQCKRRGQVMTLGVSLNYQTEAYEEREGLVCIHHRNANHAGIPPDFSTADGWDRNVCPTRLKSNGHAQARRRREAGLCSNCW